MAVSRDGWVTLIAPNPAGTIVWADSIPVRRKRKREVDLIMN
jgi:hypothetical protein